MKIKDLLEITTDELFIRPNKKIAKMVFDIAEEMAYDESSEGNQPVTGDQILQHVDHTLKEVRKLAANLIKKEYT